MFDLELRRIASNSSPQSSIDYQRFTNRSNVDSSRIDNKIGGGRAFRTSRSESNYHTSDKSFNLSINSGRNSLKFNDTSESDFGDDSYYTSLSNIKLPRVVVKNGMGHALRTESSFQRAIAEARVRIREEGRKLTSEEWRLPEAPVPSKPDYSRIGNIEDGHIIKHADKKKLKVNASIDYTDPEIYVKKIATLLVSIFFIIIIFFLFKKYVLKEDDENMHG